MPGRIVVMGVSGSGKSTVAGALARSLQLPVADADDLHPGANVAKMSRGEALDDADRRPWLDAVGRWLAGHEDGGVVACSALRRTYRDQLRQHAPDVFFVHLSGSREVLEARIAHRTDHFMPASLLTSQLATLEPLEPDEPGVVIDIDRCLDAIVGACLAALTDSPDG